MLLTSDLCSLQDKGKQLLLKIFNGGSIPDWLEAGKPFLTKLQKASIYLRWAAISLLPDAFAKFERPESDKKHPDSSVLSHLYYIAEDFILSSWSEFLLGLKPSHISLHYDGVRVSKPSDMSAEDLCRTSQEHIKAKTGFDVCVREKHHLTVLQHLRQIASSVRGSSLAQGSCLFLDGNCIPAAVALLFNTVARVEKFVSNVNLSANKAFQQSGCRSYAEIQEMLGLSVIPLPAADVLQLEPGEYLLHLEDAGKPHCVGVRVRAASQVVIYTAAQMLEMELPTLKTAVSRGIDSCASLVFKVLQAPADANARHDFWSTEALAQLLLLRARAGDFVVDPGRVDAEVIQVNSDDEVISLDSEDEIAESVAQADTAWLDDVANVTVDTALLGDLEAEVQGAVQLTSFIETEAGQRCPLCPWRCFQRRSNVLHHIKKYHTKRQQFCCSGTKQLRVVLALHDGDMISGKRGRNYLRRSAELLREKLGSSAAGFVHGSCQRT